MKYNRILLKLSGEAMGGADGQGLDSEVIKSYAVEIAKAVKAGVQIGIVVGGGNIFRGMSGVKEGFDRVKGDQMGMLATVINGKAIGIFLEEQGVKAEVFTPHPMEPFARHFSKDRAMEVLRDGGVAIFTGGTGNPFFTTDSAASLKACEIEADALLKGTKVDGVYTADPKKDPTATRYDRLTFDKALADNLKVMDQTAFTMCRENDIPIEVFDMTDPKNLNRLLSGENVGTVVSNR
ncbi:MAG: UMP kinase [Bacteroidales bacterium]|nr:UMP kinase [Bacteroidales bacterium]MBQ2483211.1 UMP kinase [Bacteroidales bacterium]MBQ4196798.1 UMP kinase [Bacteroidales bacterium]